VLGVLCTLPAPRRGGRTKEYQRLRCPETLQEKEILQRDIVPTEQAIDTLVYCLYALTDAGIYLFETS
jgi:hypothetical protein